jgi:hypothetical protein
MQFSLWVNVLDLCADGHPSWVRSILFLAIVSMLQILVLLELGLVFSFQEELIT